MKNNKTPQIDKFLKTLFGEYTGCAYILLYQIANGLGTTKPVIINGAANMRELEHFDLIIDFIAPENFRNKRIYHPTVLHSEDLNKSQRKIDQHSKCLYIHYTQLEKTLRLELLKGYNVLFQTKKPAVHIPWIGILKEIQTFQNNLLDVK